MSDPVTNVAIEDVLSSIRRLVSEDARVRPLGLRAEPEVPEAAAGKLVLTPALRVSAPAADDAQDDAPQHDAAQSEEPGAVGQDDAGDAQAHDGVFDDQPAADDAQAAIAEQAQPVEDAALAWEDHLDDTRDAAPLRLSDALVTDIAEATTDRGDAAWTAPDAADALPETLLSGATEPHDEWTMSSLTPEGDDVLIADPDDASASADFVFASSRDAAGHEDATAQAAAYAAADKGDESTSSIFREEDTILDEESLRELVAEIVRQELQGALGERITRNVRKLVRREIHRALTSHELE